MAKVGINREIGHLTEIADCRETCCLYQYKRIQEIIHIIYNVKGIYNVEVWDMADGLFTLIKCLLFSTKWCQFLLLAQCY